MTIGRGAGLSAGGTGRSPHARAQCLPGVLSLPGTSVNSGLSPWTGEPRRRICGQGQKRKCKLLHEAQGNVVADDAIAVGPLAKGLDGGAEEVVEKREVRRVVLVDGLGILRVVPAMEFGVTTTYRNGPRLALTFA